MNRQSQDMFFGGLLGFLLGGIFIGIIIRMGQVTVRIDARAAALQWAKSAPAYTLIDTHMFNGNEWKTYRQNKTGKLFLLTPGGEWISVED